jgi:2-hydroxychromene-2-carboxylate isomerase
MTTYRVSWDIDIDADSPEEAAKIARECQLDPASLATVFIVSDPDKTYKVDTFVTIERGN